MDDAARDFLRSRGVTDDELERATAEGWVGLLLVERLATLEPEQYTLDELAASADTTPEFARRFFRTVGMPDRPPDERAFTDEDAQAIRGLHQLVHDLPLTDDDLLDRSRVINAAMGRIAEVFADIVSDLQAENLPLDDMLGMLTERLPIANEVLANARDRQFKLALERRLAAFQTSQDTTADLAIGFADLVGFTTLSRRVSMEQLTDVINRFEDAAYECASRYGATIVKTIGDEVMLSRSDPVAATHAVLDLVARFKTDDSLPAIRAGLDFGPVIAWHGDRFGPTVNQASRLVHVARPNNVVIGPGMRDALRPHQAVFDIRSLGTTRLKGIGPVRCWRVRRVRRHDGVAPPPEDSGEQQSALDVPTMMDGMDAAGSQESTRDNEAPVSKSAHRHQRRDKHHEPRQND